MLKNTVIVDEIEKIEEINFDGFVYDVSCEDPHMYITSGFISHNCVLWFDEIEKGLSGAKSSGETDGGTTSRVISTFLTWMQEKTKPVFIFATANDYKSIPPEFMRRFDETFYVDLPNLNERKQIFKVLIKKYKRNYEDFDIVGLAKITENFSGAEIEKVIVNSLFLGFSDDKREMNTDDLRQSISLFKPLYLVRQEEFDDLKSWAKTRCVSANLEIIKSSDDDISVSNLQIG